MILFPEGLLINYEDVIEHPSEAIVVQSVTHDKVIRDLLPHIVQYQGCILVCIGLIQHNSDAHLLSTSEEVEFLNLCQGKPGVHEIFQHHHYASHDIDLWSHYLREPPRGVHARVRAVLRKGHLIRLVQQVSNVRAKHKCPIEDTDKERISVSHICDDLLSNSRNVRVQLLL